MRQEVEQESPELLRPLLRSDSEPRGLRGLSSLLLQGALVLYLLTSLLIGPFLLLQQVLPAHQQHGIHVSVALSAQGHAQDDALEEDHAVVREDSPRGNELGGKEVLRQRID